MALASAFLVAPPAVLGLFFGKDGIRLLGDYKVSFIAAESCFVLSVFWGYLVLGSLAGSQDKGTYNVHRTATRIISWFQIVTYLIGAGLFVTLLLTLPEPPNPDSKHSTFTTALGLVPELGGPYAIGGGAIPESNQVKTKLAEFEAFHATMWGFSKVEVLSPELFKKSVARNKVSGVPYTEKYQRYNYVVRAVDDDELQILVAIWSWPSEEGEEATFGKICKKRNAEESLASAYATATVGQGVMVNFFPEDTDLPSAQSQNSRLKSSPCSIKYIDVRGTVKFTGVLDASGKHFMLAQGSGTYLEAYPSVKKKEIDKSELTQTIGRDWVQTKVLYAGEIIVDVKGCNYFINQGSGTYRPKPGDDLKFLLEVAEVFRKVLGSPPALVWVREIADQHTSVRAWPVRADNYKRELVCP